MKITGRHLVVTPALRRHIREKFERLDRYGVPPDRTAIILGVNKLQHTAEAVCSIGGKRFQAKTSTREMYATIDQLVDCLEAQIRKHKDRRTEHKHGKAASRRFSQPMSASSEEEIEIVRPVVSVLSRAAATNRLDPRPGSVIVFTCADSGKLQILRRVENGKIVLIDP
ncbi:MAG: ribosome-associated translation inhibitor RaiA [Nitrospira sp. CR1.3]|nr:ribosome-associated translation inhibitor RaiA [Nitrospira sp. CR1.3]